MGRVRGAIAVVAAMGLAQVLGCAGREARQTPVAPSSGRLSLAEIGNWRGYDGIEPQDILDWRTGPDAALVHETEARLVAAMQQRLGATMQRQRTDQLVAEWPHGLAILRWEFRSAAGTAKASLFLNGALHVERWHEAFAPSLDEDETAAEGAGTIPAEYWGGVDVPDLVWMREGHSRCEWYGKDGASRTDAGLVTASTGRGYESLHAGTFHARWRRTTVDDTAQRLGFMTQRYAIACAVAHAQRAVPNARDCNWLVQRAVLIHDPGMPGQVETPAQWQVEIRGPDSTMFAVTVEPRSGRARHDPLYRRSGERPAPHGQPFSFGQVRTWPEYVKVVQTLTTRRNETAKMLPRVQADAARIFAALGEAAPAKWEPEVDLAEDTLRFVADGWIGSHELGYEMGRQGPRLSVVQLYLRGGAGEVEWERAAAVEALGVRLHEAAFGKAPAGRAALLDSDLLPRLRPERSAGPPFRMPWYHFAWRPEAAGMALPGPFCARFHAAGGNGLRLVLERAKADDIAQAREAVASRGAKVEMIAAAAKVARSLERRMDLREATFDCGMVLVKADALKDRGEVYRDAEALQRLGSRVVPMWLVQMHLRADARLDAWLDARSGRILFLRPRNTATHPHAPVELIMPGGTWPVARHNM